MSNIDLSLLPDFIVEAEEHLEELEALLLKLVQQPDDLELLNDIFRPIHTIKGGAQYIGLEKISQLSHRLEDLLDLLRNGNLPSNNEIVEVLISAADRINHLVKELEATQHEESEVDDLLQRLGEWVDEDGGTAVERVTEAPSAATEPSTSDSAYASGEDRELYEIFEQHLQDNYEGLAAQLQQLAAGEDVIAALQQSLNLLGQMRSSANYMDYVDLVQRYQIWMGELENLLQQAQGGEPLMLDGLLRNMQELADLFPVLGSIELPSADTLIGAVGEAGDISDAVARAFAQGSAPETESAATEVEEQRLADTEPAEEAGNIDFSLLDDYIIEAEEHLDEMEALLLQLVAQPSNLDLLNDIFRTVHSIKGSAQYIGLSKISRLTHVQEDLLDLLRSGEIESDSTLVDLLIAARDRILRINGELKQSQREQSEVDDLVELLNSVLNKAQPAATAPMEEETAETSREPVITPYQEEDDQELFSIFLDHMQEQHDGIVALLNALDSGADRVETLDSCEELVEKLSSSANYMDYVDLVQRYKVWLNEIDKTRDELRLGAEASIAFMQQNLSELRALFPQLQLAAAAQQPEPESESESSFKVVVNEPVAGGLEDTLAKKTGGERAAPVQALPSLDEQLFDSLSGALERSLPQGSDNQEYDTLNKIFDELVSGGTRGVEKAVPSAVAPAKTPLPAEAPAARADSKAKRESAESKVKKSVRVDAEKIDTLMNQVGELVVDRSYFFQLMTEMRNLQRHLKDTLGLEQKEVKLLRTFTYRLGEAIASLGRTSNDLQEGVMKMRMLPISQIFNRYPRLVHDLTRNSEKSVNLVVKGEDTELDRMIVEELSDPLIHIIRNAVDHGLETVAERRAEGKSDEGTLVLEAYQESNHIVIEVTDDGKGIDPQRVRQKAIAKGLYSADELERFTNDEIIGLIMTAGFSTADKITGTSGRGVGMDVVKKNIEKLNGTLEIDSKVGVGTQMRLKIPLTLAIIHALMVRVSKDLFTIPLANVDETVRIFKDETSTVEGVEVIHLRGETLPIFRLSTLFGENGATQQDKSFVVIVSVGGQRTGFVVDELLGQEEVVIKPLADYVQDKSGFSGATIIGDGRISLILDVYEMVRMTANKQARKQKQQTELLKSKIRRANQVAKPATVEDAAH